MFFMLSFQTEQERLKFESLYIDYRNIMFKCALNILKRHTLAEDATSEAFIRIYNNLHKINEKNRNETIGFMVTIVRNISINILNHENKKNVLLFEDISEEVQDTNDIENDVIAGLQYDELILAIGGLKNELEAPLILRYVYGYSDKEISEILDITENNVAVRVHRAKKALIKILNERGVRNEGQKAK